MTGFDVVVLGGGFSGTRAALKAADLGGKVCLIEKEVLGKKGFLRRNVLLPESCYKSEKEPNEIDKLFKTTQRNSNIEKNTSSEKSILNKIRQKE